MHVHSAFHRKVGLQRAGIEEGGARANTEQKHCKNSIQEVRNKPETTCMHSVIIFHLKNKEKNCLISINIG